MTRTILPEPPDELKRHSDRLVPVFAVIAALERFQDPVPIIRIADVATLESCPRFRRQRFTRVLIDIERQHLVIGCPQIANQGGADA